MKRSVKQLSLAIICMNLGFAAFAAQPGNTTMPTTNQPTMGTGMTVKVTLPGTLMGFKSVGTEVDADKPLMFKFEGTGHCKAKLSSGDGLVTNFEGDLPFSAPYTYSTTTMSSYDSFKKYTATVTTEGNCKIAGAISGIVVTVNNPTPQGVTPSGSGQPVMDATIKPLKKP